MRKVKAKNTSPELKLRRLLCDLGFRGYRLHYSKLPGTPDVVFVSRKKAIFVHGCFWHGHDCKAGKNVPRTNQEYWKPKLERNKKRDVEWQNQLRSIGWDVLVVWECQLKFPENVCLSLGDFLSTS